MHTPTALFEEWTNKYLLPLTPGASPLVLKRNAWEVKIMLHADAMQPLFYNVAVAIVLEWVTVGHSGD